MLQEERILQMYPERYAEIGLGNKELRVFWAERHRKEYV